jgi:regulator of sigma E protease
MAAGVVMNLLVAVVLLTILCLIGIPKLQPINNQFTIKSDTKTFDQKILINQVEKGSPAQKAGLKSEDLLTAIGPVGKKLTSVTDANNLSNQIEKYAGQKVQVDYQRNGHDYTAQTTLVAGKVVTASRNQYVKKVKATKLDCANIPPPKGYLGITYSQYSLRKSTWSAPITAVGLTAQITALTFEGLGHALAGLGSLIAGLATGNSTARSNGQCAATSQVAGPVGIVVILKDGSSLGLRFMLFIIAIISLTLAIMNFLPIPALDGGRLWITLIAHAFKKPLKSKTEELINAVGFTVLIILIILITIVDVQRFF